MASRIETSRVITQNAVELTAVGGASADDTSSWFPCEGVAEHEVWLFQVLATATGGDLDVFIDYSDIDYYTLRNTTATTAHYKRIAVVAAESSEIRARYTISDVGDLEFPPASFRIYVDNDSAKASTVTITVVGKG